MKLVFIDLETTGIPIRPSYDAYYPYNYSKYYENARVIQIAVIVYEDDKQRDEFNFFIKPDGFVIKNSEFHGITQEIANEKGIPFIDAMEKIYPAICDADRIIAHNVEFDRNVLLAEMFVHSMIKEIRVLERIKTFCTSMGCIRITKIERNGMYKQPKLTELYEFLFGKKFKQTHDALDDTQTLVSCFFELLKKKYLTMKSI